MNAIKSAWWVAIAVAVWIPATVQAQHEGHEQHAAPVPTAPSEGQHQLHDDRSQTSDPQVDHSQAHGEDGLREPIPLLTDADRAAAFPPLRDYHKHGTSVNSFWLMDQLEASDTNDGTEIGWEGIGWVGSDINRLWLRTKGHALDGSVEKGRFEVLYGKAIHRWWDLVAGARQDFGSGPSRTWAAFGVQGLAPYFFEVEATAYLGDNGRTAAVVEVDYDMLFTNRLILTWAGEVNLFGKSDPAQNIGSGLSTVEAGLRLRYEFTRRFAPYIGFEREWSYGQTADLRELAGHARSDSRWVAGLRLWF